MPVRRRHWFAILLVVACAEATKEKVQPPKIEPPPTSTDSGIDSPVVQDVVEPARAKAIAIAAGGKQSCAILEDHRVKCWGDGIGVRPDDMGDALPEIVLPPGFVAAHIVAHRTQACALSTTGDVSCWGRDRQAPPPYLSNVLQISASDDHTCALRDDRTLWCWPGDQKPSQVAVDFTPIRVFAGYGRTFAIDDQNALHAWGDNTFGTLGQGDTDDRPTAKPIVNLGAGAAVKGVFGGAAYTCAALSLGLVKCWGTLIFDNGDCSDACGDAVGEMGDALLPVAGIASQDALTANRASFCGLKNGAVQCWGRDLQYGTLGAFMVPNARTAGIVNLGEPASAIAAGRDHTCALLASGGIKCWGRNDVGQLGVGDTTNRGSLDEHMGEELPYVSLSGPRAADPEFVPAIAQCIPGRCGKSVSIDCFETGIECGCFDQDEQPDGGSICTGATSSFVAICPTQHRYCVARRACVSNAVYYARCPY